MTAEGLHGILDGLGWLLVLVLVAFAAWLAMMLPDEGLLNPPTGDFVGAMGNNGPL